MNKAILWDLDGTLVDSEPAHRGSFKAAIGALGLLMPDNFEKRVLGTNERAVYQLLCNEANLTLSLEDWRSLKWSHYKALSSSIKQRKETAPALEQVRAMGLQSAIVTNSTRDELKLNVNAASIAKYFDVMVCVQDVTAPKPAPESYQLAASKLGKAVEECIVVEDSVTGAQAGVNAGMQVILFPQTTLDPKLVPKGTTYVDPNESFLAALELKIR